MEELMKQVLDELRNLNGRMDSFESRMDSLEQTVDKRFNSVEGSLERIERKQDAAYEQIVRNSETLTVIKASVRQANEYLTDSPFKSPLTTDR